MSPGSPAIDAGTALTDVTEDIEGLPRPQGDTWEIGAYEQPVAQCSVDADCDDGLFCNGNEVCNAGTCTAGVNPCPGQQCDELFDLCVDPVCNDNGVCESGEDCGNCATDCISGGDGVAQSAEADGTLCDGNF